MTLGELRENDARAVENVFKKLFKDSEVRTLTKVNSIFVSVDRGGKHLADFRVGREVTELYLLTSEVGLEVLKELGFEDLYNVLREAGNPAEIVISKSPASKSVHLLVAGNYRQLPNIRVVIRADSHEAVASYCRVGGGSNTCALLSKLIKICRSLWEDFFLRS